MIHYIPMAVAVVLVVCSPCRVRLPFRRELGQNRDLLNKDLITASYFENVTRFHKIKGTTEASLTILRKQFLDKLSDEIRRLAQMDVPILIVWGREDKAIPLRCGEEMYRILKGSRLEIIDDAGHVPNYERPEVFNQLAMDFFA